MIALAINKYCVVYLTVYSMFQMCVVVGIQLVMLVRELDCFMCTCMWWSE